MSESTSILRPAPVSVWQLRRKKIPDEISLPADYVPTDYTSLPPEEPKKKSRAPLLLGMLVMLLALAGIVYAVLIKPGEEQPTPVPKVNLNITRARMLVSGDKLTTTIDATTDAPSGTDVTATLLQDGEPIEFWVPEEATQKVDAGKVAFSIPEADGRPNGKRDAKYSVRLTANVAGTASSAEKELEIVQAASERFYGPAVTDAPTATLTSAPTSEATTPEPQPTATPAIGAKPVPLDSVVVTGSGVVYTSPYGPASPRGNVNPKDIARVVVKMPVGAETWYLVAIASNGTSGWVNSTAIDLPASDVAKITQVSGEAPYAVVFNGGNVRTAPGDSVVTQVDAGYNVKMTARTATNDWIQIEFLDGSNNKGWIVSSLLTINPEALNAVPVQ